MDRMTAVARSNPQDGVTFVSPGTFLEEMDQRFTNVARRAFELFEANGHDNGHELDDWLRAESELYHPVHLEIAEADNTLTVKAEVPGFTENDLKVSVEPRRLTIAGKRNGHTEKKSGRTLYTETCSDEILRVVDLPKEVDPDDGGIKASCSQGMLTVTLPEVPRAKAREIKIR